ncbi:hypothetical protein EYZ11_008458 [Aspergillus tanneri]|uniref:Uncharacterized protein n=1 Tax=Aspergillus tanneri TaxID=1220188 RepID=A0A4S3JCK6_9EURO|nr:hypothetical protein EYZ11_008458 [Aspergillus tanneri]
MEAEGMRIGLWIIALVRAHPAEAVLKNFTTDGHGLGPLPSASKNSRWILRYVLKHQIRS